MNTFIITAGGIGKRMGTALPKQFIVVNDKPVLLHTLERFYDADPQAEIFITLPEEWKNYWLELLEQYKCTISHQIVTGGIERYDSIKNALEIATGDIVSVHDGVRPLVSIQTIKNCIESAKMNGSGIPYLPLKESIRKLQGQSSVSLNRTDYLSIQTPQSFQIDTLKKAYQLPFHSAITDDASLVEEAGYAISLVLGNEENIKITTPIDLKLLELLLLS